MSKVISKGGPAEQRAEKLAQALRENLRRRKVQARAVTDAGSDTEAVTAPAMTPDTPDDQ